MMLLAIPLSKIPHMLLSQRKCRIHVQRSFEERLEDIWLSLLLHVVGVTVRCPPTSLQAVAGLYYCHSAHKQKSALETKESRRA